MGSQARKSEGGRGFLMGMKGQNHAMRSRDSKVARGDWVWGKWGKGPHWLNPKRGMPSPIDVAQTGHLAKGELGSGGTVDDVVKNLVA